jgi:hypothetical protein
MPSQMPGEPSIWRRSVEGRSRVRNGAGLILQRENPEASMRSKLMWAALAAGLLAFDPFAPTVSAQLPGAYSWSAQGSNPYYSGYAAGYATPYGYGSYSYSYRPYYAGYVAPYGYAPYYGGYSAGYAAPYGYAAPFGYGAYRYGYRPHHGNVYYRR